MNHTFNSKELGIILGGKENTVIMKDYVPCPSSAKVSVIFVNFGEPTTSFFDNYHQKAIHKVSMAPTCVLGPCPWSDMIGRRMDMCSVLSQSASSPLESLGLDFRDASHELLELGDANIRGSHSNLCGKRNRGWEKQHWRNKDKRASEYQLMPRFLKAFSHFQILPFTLRFLEISLILKIKI